MHFGSTRQSHPRAIADGFHLGRRCFFGTPQDSRARCVRRRCKGAAATHFTHPPREGRRLLDRTPCTSIRRQPARPTGRRGAAWRPSRRAHVPAQPGPTCTALPCCTPTRTQRPQQPGEARPGRPQPGEQADVCRSDGVPTAARPPPLQRRCSNSLHAPVARRPQAARPHSLYQRKATARLTDRRDTAWRVATFQARARPTTAGPHLHRTPRLYTYVNATPGEARPGRPQPGEQASTCHDDGAATAARQRLSTATSSAFTRCSCTTCGQHGTAAAACSVIFLQRVLLITDICLQTINFLPPRSFPAHAPARPATHRRPSRCQRVPYS